MPKMGKKRDKHSKQAENRALSKVQVAWPCVFRRLVQARLDRLPAKAPTVPRDSDGNTHKPVQKDSSLCRPG